MPSNIQWNCCGQEAAYAEDHATGHLFAEEILKKEYFAPFLDNLILERYDKDSGHIKPNNKFVTGADIEAIIEGAKRRIYHSGINRLLYSLAKLLTKL